MKKFNKTITPEDIVAVCGGEYHGEQNITLQSVADPDEADSSSVIFWEQEKYLDAVKKSPAVLIFCHPDKANNLPNRNLILHPHPYFAFLRLVDWWIEQDAEKPIPEIHPTAIIDPSAIIGDGVYIGPYCIIGKNCQIENDSIIEAHCFISNNVSIGKNTHLYPNVNIYADTRIGNGVIIHSGTVIGADGFGFILMDGVQNKIPQVGNVVIEDFVEIQANSAVDRGTLSSTFIGQGTKIDNFVQIGHNCRIGKHCILCAQVGLAGSTILGDYVYLAGQVGVAGHLKIGDRAMVGAQSGITNDIPADARYWGSPAMEADRFKRILVSQKHLPEIYRFYLKQKKKEEEET